MAVGMRLRELTHCDEPTELRAGDAIVFLGKTCLVLLVRNYVVLHWREEELTWVQGVHDIPSFTEFVVRVAGHYGLGVRVMDTDDPTAYAYELTVSKAQRRRAT